jgi:hypothetical protein
MLARGSMAAALYTTFQTASEKLCYDFALLQRHGSIQFQLPAEALGKALQEKIRRKKAFLSGSLGMALESGQHVGIAQTNGKVDIQSWFRNESSSTKLTR